MSKDTTRTLDLLQADRYRASNVCTHCGSRTPPVGRSQCDFCAERRKEYRKAENYLMKHAARERVRRRQIKLRVITHYSRGSLKCCMCDEARLGALTIDHINNDGGQHRRLISRRGCHFYRWLCSEGFPLGYRVLCSNHNIKQYLLMTINSLIMTKYAIDKRKRDVDLKARFMAALGGRCIECSISDLEILTCHHINNDGAEHRRLLNVVGGAAFYRVMLKIGDFSKVECRCFSCNDLLEWGD